MGQSFSVFDLDRRELLDPGFFGSGVEPGDVEPPPHCGPSRSGMRRLSALAGGVALAWMSAAAASGAGPAEGGRGAPPAVQPSPARGLRCKGEREGEERVQELRARREEDSFYRFARRLLGAPTACEVSWEEFDGQAFGSLRYRFEDGTSLRMESHPPETFLLELRTARGFVDEAGARAFLKEAASKQGLRPAWESVPERAAEESPCVTRETYWDPDVGLNAGATLLFRGGKLVGIGLHGAL
jgi:hypothetical protein